MIHQPTADGTAYSQPREGRMNASLSEFVQLITIDDLTEDMKLIAESCGIEVAHALMLNMPGLRFYVPAPQRMTDVVFRYIMSDRRKRKQPYTEADQKKIALSLSISTAYVGNVIRRVEQAHMEELGANKNIVVV